MFTTYETARDHIYGLKRYNQSPNFDNLKAALSKLGNPHLGKRFVHITGTNGKGSVAAMMESILRAAGYRSGLFTSPHLVDYTERMQIDRVSITSEQLLTHANRILSLGIPLTFFEVTTLIGLLHFHNEQCEWIILEAGMGGTHDPTNIITPSVSIITNVDLDHTEVLGGTIAQIACDKAGIIKLNVPIVTAATGEAKRIIFETAIRNNAMLVSAEPYDYDVGLLGEHQRINAGIAYEAARLLEIPNELIRSGIKSVQWPGRLDYIEHGLLVDCAHNPAGIRTLTTYLNTLQRPMIIIFGALAHKNWQEMIRLLPPCMELIMTTADENKGVNALELTGIRPCTAKATPALAFAYARSIAGKDDLIVVCGSCYLTGAIMGHVCSNALT
ncbi:hypothetical protein HY641_05355 [Candidatus Woesearchaeota archaeon]|nr:hypothetical protein [Candidatus Woesearchaeota archaeon]